MFFKTSIHKKRIKEKTISIELDKPIPDNKEREAVCSQRKNGLSTVFRNVGKEYRRTMLFGSRKSRGGEDLNLFKAQKINKQSRWQWLGKSLYRNSKPNEYSIRSRNLSTYNDLASGNAPHRQEQGHKNHSMDRVSISEGSSHMLSGVCFESNPSKPKFRYEKQKQLVVLFSGSHFSAKETFGRLIKDYLDDGFDVLSVDYRGFGDHPYQNINEQTLHSDVRNILDKALDIKHAKSYEKPILLHGFSLGAPLAAHGASYLNRKKRESFQLVLHHPLSNVNKRVFDEVKKIGIGSRISRLTANWFSLFSELHTKNELKGLDPLADSSVFIYQSKNDEELPGHGQHVFESLLEDFSSDHIVMETGIGNHFQTDFILTNPEYRTYLKLRT